MLQQSLLNQSDIDLKSLLQHHAVYSDKLFWTPKEASRLLELSGYQTYWLIWRCRLDALSICGEYRIPWFSIIDYLEDRKKIKRQFWAYKNLLTDKETDTDQIYVRSGLAPEEPDPEDYYHLQDLDIPNEVELWDLAMILRVSPDALRKDWPWSGTVLHWPEIYDYLIENEVVNTPVFINRKTDKKYETVEDLQLALF
ncbi:MAG: hypothetical protein ACPKOP_11920 [Sphaerochaetaceae bacterium]